MRCNTTPTIHYTCICELVKEFPSEAVLAEIGCYEGEATMIFAEHCKKVYAIDPWKSGYDDSDVVSKKDLDYVYDKVFTPNIARFNNVEVIRKASIDAISQITIPLQVVYIDGKHTYEAVKEDIKIWLPKLSKDGLLCGHDYIDGWEDVIKAVNEIIGRPDKIYKDGS